VSTSDECVRFDGTNFFFDGPLAVAENGCLSVPANERSHPQRRTSQLAGDHTDDVAIVCHFHDRALSSGDGLAGSARSLGGRFTHLHHVPCQFKAGLPLDIAR